MGSTEKFCLRWNDFESNISVAFREIREEKDFFDCTLSVGDRQIQAHKLILSACSPFFRSVLRKNPHQHPLLYLKGVEFSDLQAILNFMYHGEVNVAPGELNSFLAVAEDLKVKGLTQCNSSDGMNSGPKQTPTSVYPLTMFTTIPQPVPTDLPTPNNSSSEKMSAPKENLKNMNITTKLNYSSHCSKPLSSTTAPQAIPADPPLPERHCSTPQCTKTTQKDDVNIQVKIPVVKTEKVSEQQQGVSTYQQSVVQSIVQTLTQVEDRTVYEEDRNDYGGYEDMETTSKDKEDRLLFRAGPKYVQCLAPDCGRTFSRPDNCRRHIREVHIRMDK